ncbi:hypothetical protein B0A55_13492, partial [Friedmanniomyces simplex]
GSMCCFGFVKSLLGKSKRAEDAGPLLSSPPAIPSPPPSPLPPLPSSPIDIVRPQRRVVPSPPPLASTPAFPGRPAGQE